MVKISVEGKKENVDLFYDVMKYLVSEGAFKGNLSVREYKKSGSKISRHFNVEVVDMIEIKKDIKLLPISVKVTGKNFGEVANALKILNSVQSWYHYGKNGIIMGKNKDGIYAKMYSISDIELVKIKFMSDKTPILFDGNFNVRRLSSMDICF